MTKTILGIDCVNGITYIGELAINEDELKKLRGALVIKNYAVVQTARLSSDERKSFLEKMIEFYQITKKDKKNKYTEPRDIVSSYELDFPVK